MKLFYRSGHTIFIWGILEGSTVERTDHEQIKKPTVNAAKRESRSMQKSGLYRFQRPA